MYRNTWIVVVALDASWKYSERKSRTEASSRPLLLARVAQRWPTDAERALPLNAHANVPASVAMLTTIVQTAMMMDPHRTLAPQRQQNFDTSIIFTLACFTCVAAPEEYSNTDGDTAGRGASQSVPRRPQGPAFSSMTAKVLRCDAKS